MSTVKIGIVGSTANKFDIATMSTALRTIANIIEHALQHSNDIIIVSGGSPNGGIDEWAEKIAHSYNLETKIYKPTRNTWEGNGGFKARNIAIANTATEVHCIVPQKYPESYRGRKEIECYHCIKHGHNAQHIKSAGCWTGWYAASLNKPYIQHVIKTPSSPVGDDDDIPR